MFTIRNISRTEFDSVGSLVVDVYSKLEGMPGIQEQPEYYSMLKNVSKRASNTKIQIIVALDSTSRVLGSVDFIEDMEHYSSGGNAGLVPNACGIRLLAVRPDYQGKGIGKALTEQCIYRAKELKKSSIILHTTRAMMPAWRMYEKLGFKRDSSLDFKQGELEVFGFQTYLSE